MGNGIRQYYQFFPRENVSGFNLPELSKCNIWPLHERSWLIGKDSDAGRDWGQEEKGTTEDEMAGWHHWLDGHEFEPIPGDGEVQGRLACCSTWGRKETRLRDWTTTAMKSSIKKSFSLLFLKGISSKCRFLYWYIFSFSSLNLCFTNSCWHCRLWGLGCHSYSLFLWRTFFSLAALNISTFSPILSRYIVICLCFIFFTLLVLSVHWTPLICGLQFSSNLEKYWPLVLQISFLLWPSPLL